MLTQVLAGCPYRRSLRPRWSAGRRRWRLVDETSQIAGAGPPKPRLPIKGLGGAQTSGARLSAAAGAAAARCSPTSTRRPIRHQKPFMRPAIAGKTTAAARRSRRPPLASRHQRQPRQCRSWRRTRSARKPGRAGAPPCLVWS